MEIYDILHNTDMRKRVPRTHWQRHGPHDTGLPIMPITPIRLPSTELRRSMPTLCGCLLLFFGGACAPVGTAPEEGTGVLSLQDDDNAALSVSLEVQQQTMAAGQDILLDWSNLRTDMWGRDLDPLVDIENPTLRHFGRADLNEIIDGLVAESLPQSAVALQVSCTVQEAACFLSEMAFDDDHPIDVVELFEEGEGTWLLELRHAGNGESVAYQALAPSNLGTDEVAWVTGHSSSAAAWVELAQPLTLPAVAMDELVLTWDEITMDSRGHDLDPWRLDRFTLARLDHEDVQSGEATLLNLEAMTEEAWHADIEGVSTLHLSSLEDAANQHRLPDLSTPGLWLLTLECSTCTNPLPDVLIRLEP